MADLTSLYQDLILDHCRHPLHEGKLPNHTHSAVGANPICGDELTIYLQISNNIINAIQFEGSGCAIAIATTSLMCDFLEGKSIEEGNVIFKLFHQMMVCEDLADLLESFKKLDKLQVLANVKNYPMRIKCATLPWHTFKAALEQKSGPISTEAEDA